MQFQDVVRRRRMVRNFDERPVPAELVERLLTNAVRAPSAGFTQGWAFLVLEGHEETSRFWSASFPVEERTGFRHQGIFRAPVLIVPLASMAAYLDRYAEPDKGYTDRDETRWRVPYWHVDAAFATLLMLLTAVDVGLGALFFAVSRVEELRAAFGVPEDYAPVGAVVVGYPLPDEPSPSLARGRRPLHEVVHRGHW